MRFEAEANTRCTWLLDTKVSCTYVHSQSTDRPHTVHRSQQRTSTLIFVTLQSEPIYHQHIHWKHSQQYTCFIGVGTMYACLRERFYFFVDMFHTLFFLLRLTFLFFWFCFEYGVHSVASSLRRLQQFQSNLMYTSTSNSILN